MRMRRVTVEKDADGAEQTTRMLSERRRAPNRVCVVAGELRRDQPESWEFQKLDWNTFRVIWCTTVAPDVALSLTRGKDPGNDEFLGLVMYDVLRWPDAHRYDVSLDDSNILRSISLLDQWQLFSELIEGSQHVRLGQDEKEINGVKCRTVSLVEPTREHTFWIDASDRSLVRRLEIYRKADDESFGDPLWRTKLSAQELEDQQHPDAADLSVWSRTVVDFSDFKDIGGALLPWVAEFEMTSMNRDGETKISKTKVEIASLKVLDDPLPPSAFELSAPDGTPVRRSPDNDKPKMIWRGGRVVPAESFATTTTSESR